MSSLCLIFGSTTLWASFIIVVMAGMPEIGNKCYPLTADTSTFHWPRHITWLSTTAMGQGSRFHQPWEAMSNPTCGSVEGSVELAYGTWTLATGAQKSTLQHALRSRWSVKTACSSRVQTSTASFETNAGDSPRIDPKMSSLPILALSWSLGRKELFEMWDELEVPRKKKPNWRPLELLLSTYTSICPSATHKALYLFAYSV